MLSDKRLLNKSDTYIHYNIIGIRHYMSTNITEMQTYVYRQYSTYIYVIMFYMGDFVLFVG